MLVTPAKGDNMRYKSINTARYKVLCGSAQEDPTYENWLRLAEAIFSGQTRLADLYDKKEELLRIKEIDELRARGEKTLYQIEEEISKPIRRKKPNFKPESIPVLIKNLETGEKGEFNSIKQACEANDINASYARLLFRKKEADEIIYNGFLIKKLKKEVLESKIEVKRMKLNPYIDINVHKTPWTDEEKAFVAQNRPAMLLREIAVCLGRSAESCSNAYREMKKKGTLEYYKKFDISDKVGA